MPEDNTIKQGNSLEGPFKNTLRSRNDSSPKIGWLCTYTPEELIIAAGFTPIRLFGAKKLEKSESYFPINFCPYLKSSWESIMASGKGYEGFVFTDSCDGMRRLYDTSNIYFKDAPSLMIDVPRVRSGRSIDFFKYNLGKLAGSLKKLGGGSISAVKLEDAVYIMDSKRKALQDFSSLFKKLKGAVSISTYYEVMKLSMTSDPVVFTKELKGFIKSMEKAEPESNSSPDIMIIGNFITEEKLWEMFSKPRPEPCS